MTRLLILVPTSFERRHLQPAFEDAVRAADGIIAVCGFGPIASGIVTTQLLAQHTPKRVILLGIAGAFHPRISIGTAQRFTTIGCFGIGAGNGIEFQTAGDLGWHQWTDPDSGQFCGDIIELEGPAAKDIHSSKILLTVCSASASVADHAYRLQKFPQAVAEDMESFSVALACRLSGTTLDVIRGISNVAGDRNKANWKIDAALEAAANLTMSRLSL